MSTKKRENAERRQLVLRSQKSAGKRKARFAVSLHSKSYLIYKKSDILKAWVKNYSTGYWVILRERAWKRPAGGGLDTMTLLALKGEVSSFCKVWILCGKNRFWRERPRLYRS
jgi:hypothetical protein